MYILSYGFRGTPVVARMFAYTARTFFLDKLKNVQEQKTLKKKRTKSGDTAAKKSIYKDK